MGLFKVETVNQVREAHPFLNTIVERFPSFFMPSEEIVSTPYRVAKFAFQTFLGIASGVFAVTAAINAPAIFFPAFGVGLCYGVVIYLFQTVIRRKIQYEGSWAMLYVQGCSLLKKKWRWLEVAALVGGVLAVYAVSTSLMLTSSSWAFRQSGLLAGVSVAYLGCDACKDICTQLFRRFYPVQAPAAAAT